MTAQALAALYRAASALEDHALDAPGGHHCWLCDAAKDCRDAAAALTAATQQPGGDAPPPA